MCQIRKKFFQTDFEKGADKIQNHAFRYQSRAKMTHLPSDSIPNGVETAEETWS